jgi:hypothetical protein
MESLGRERLAVRMRRSASAAAAAWRRLRSRLSCQPAKDFSMNRLSARMMAAAHVAAAVWLLGGTQAALAQPSVSHVVPGAVAPGKTTELTLHGAKLDGALRIWTSFPARVEIVAGDPKDKDRKSVTCKLTLGSGVPPGIGGIAVTSEAGQSDIVYLMIDDLPSVAEGDNNHTAAAPQDVSLPVAIDGQCDGTLFDCYRFAAKAGERISCEVVGARLGWDFDALVRVLDATGKELLLADDDLASSADPRFIFTAPADGKYTLELRDNRFKPGGRYRLRLGDFPLVSTPLPLAAQSGSPIDISFRGPSPGAAASLTVLPVGGSVSAGLSALGIKLPGGQSSGWATLGLTDLPVFLEPAASNSAAPTAIQLPCLVSGALDTAGDRDLFQFQGTKGAAIRFRAISRSAGSAAIVSLRVLDAAGKQLGESPVTDSDEPVLAFTPPADGAYRLTVEELAGRGGSDFTYAVECRTGPQVSLLLKNDKNNRLRYSLPAGGALYLDVQCQRSGYDGPITLGIDSSRVGWQVVNNIIPTKANEVRLYVLPPLDLAAGELAELRVTGRAESGVHDIAAVMGTTIPLRVARPQMPYPPAWHDGAIFVSGIGPKPGFYTVTAQESAVMLPRAAGQTKLTLDFERTNDKFKDVPLVVLPLGLPAGVTAEVKRNGNGPKETYDIVLKGAKTLADGEHSFRYFAYAEMSNQGRGQTSGDIRLSIVAGEEKPKEEKPKEEKPAAENK